MEDFVPFELAKKLKEKGFTCKYPFAMCDEDGEFYPLYSSDKYYYGIEDFDKHDYVAPTISQVLKWLREKKNIILAPNPCLFKDDYCFSWDCNVWFWGNYTHVCEDYKSYEESVLAGIEYVLDNLI